MINYSLIFDWEFSNQACEVPTPRRIEMSLRACTLISIPAYLLVFLAFSKKNHEKFKIYKQKLMLSVISNMCLEFSVTLLVKPIVYFPDMAVRVGGIGFLRHSSGCISIILICVIEMANAYCLLALFNYRMHVVVDPWRHTFDFKLLKLIGYMRKCLYCSLLFSPVSVYFLYQVAIDQPAIKQRISASSYLPEYTCLSFFVIPTLSASEEFSWLNMQLFNLLIVIPNFLMFSLSLLVVYTTIKFLALLKTKAQISVFFLNFHKLYLRNLLVQLCVHVFFLGVPSVCYSGAAIYNLGQAEFTLFSLIVISLHGSVLSLLIIWMNKPLRQNLVSYFSRAPKTQSAVGEIANNSRPRSRTVTR